MAHNGGRAQANAEVRSSGYSTCGLYINALDYVQQGPFTLRQIGNDFSFWDDNPANDVADYVDQSTGAYLQPPSGYRWASTYFRGIWGKSEDRWIVTWTGTCDPVLSVGDFFAGGNIVHVPAESSPNRKVFKLTNINHVTRADGPHTRWVNKAGEFGHSLVCVFALNNQVGTVSNLRVFRPEDEARLLAGKRLSQRVIEQYAGIGVLRFMEPDFSANWMPNIADVGQVLPIGWTAANQPHYKVPGRVNATVLGPNHWQLDARPGYPAPTDGMHVNFAWTPTAMFCKVTAKGAATEFEVIGHGLSNGDRIMRRRVYWSDGVPEGGQNAFQNGTIDPVTKLFDCFPVTVVSADRFTIPYNSTSDANVFLNTSYWFMRPIKIRYAGVDYYAHHGTGKSPLIEFGPATLGATDVAKWLRGQFGNRTTAYFVIPPGKTVSDGLFIYGSGTQLHPVDLMELVNETRAHMWVALPQLANDALVQWYATYFRDNIGPGQEVWFERGNELWNTSFPWQAAMNFYAQSSAWASTRGWYGPAAGTQIKKMAIAVQSVFAGSGKTHRIVIGSQAGSGTISEKEREFFALDDSSPRPIDYADYIASAPYMFAGPTTAPYAGNTIDVTTPGFKEAVKAFKDDTRPWGQKRNGLSWLRDHLIARNTVLMNTYYTAPTGQYHVLAQKWNKKNVWYEGGTHFSYQDMSGGFDGSANALGCTYQDIKEYWWEFRHSPEAGEWLTDYYNKYASGSPYNMLPSQYYWAGFWIYSNPGLSWYWPLWGVYSPEYMTAGRTGQVEAFLAWNNTGAGAVLTGRGFLTATARGTSGASGTLSGRGSMAATGTKQVQQFYGLSDYAENACLDFLLRATGTSPTTVYLALHTGGTGEDGTTNEVSTSTGYARTAITFDAPSSGQIVSSAQVAFGPFSSSPGSVTHFSIWTAASGGNCLATGAFTSSATPQVGYSLNVPAGGIQITAN